MYAPKELNQFCGLLACVGGVFMSTASVKAQETLLVSDWEGNKVVRFDYPSGEVFDHFVGAGISPLDRSALMTETPDGNVLVASYDNHEVLLYSGQTGRFIRTFTSGDDGILLNPFGMSYGPDGDLYVVGNHSDNVLRYEGATGEYIGIAQEVFNRPQDVKFDGNGVMYVTDYLNGRIGMFDIATGFLGNVDIAGTGLAGFKGMATDLSGDIFICGDQSSSIVHVDKATGVASPFVLSGEGGLSLPSAMEFDSDGNLLVADSGTGNVLKYDSNGQFMKIVVSLSTGGGLARSFGILIYSPKEDCVVDLNSDGALNFFDISLFLTLFSAGCP
jgi:DNA-binding beta-propeller fold protein YncE